MSQKMKKYSKGSWNTLMLGLLWAGLLFFSGADRLLSAERALFVGPGVPLPGPGLVCNAGFDIVDWNQDGKKDILLATGSLILFRVYFNEGTNEKPEFGHAFFYPLNITELANGGMYQNKTFWVADWDNDGDLDFIFWGPNFRLCLNIGTALAPNHWNTTLPKEYFPGSAEFIRENTRHEARFPESAGAEPSRPILQVAVVDWDGDGKKDLIVSKFKKGDKGERGLYFYKNMKEDTDPYFDKGQEILDTSGQSIEAPNPYPVDWNDDGVPDILSSETTYWCNAFRVDWQVAPYIKIFIRPEKDNPLKLNPAQPVKDKKKQNIKPGVQAKFIDWDEDKKKDLLVLDNNEHCRLLVYRNIGRKGKPVFESNPQIVVGKDFPRHDGMTQQPFFIDWDNDGKKDFLLCGPIDNHCAFGCRRVTLFKNVTPKGQPLKYLRQGFLTYKGDPYLVSISEQKSPYECYGASIFVDDWDEDGKKDFLYTVGNRLFFFTGQKDDSLDFQRREEIKIFAPEELYNPAAWQKCTNSIFRLHPHLIDWDKDGNKDLIVGVTRIPGTRHEAARGRETEFRYYRNLGTNTKPQFDTHNYQKLIDERTNLPITLSGGSPFDNNAYFTIIDWDKDGKEDLLAQDNIKGTIRFYKNVSKDSSELKFVYVKELGNPPVSFRADGHGCYKSFFLGDIDGDKIDDLVIYRIIYSGTRPTTEAFDFKILYYKGSSPN